MAISPALRGISLVLAPLDEVSKPFETSNNGGCSETKKPTVFYLTGRVVAAYSQVRLTPQYFRGPRRGGISQSSTCISLPAEASAQAGPFLSNLEKTTFSPACQVLTDEGATSILQGA